MRFASAGVSRSVICALDLALSNANALNRVPGKSLIKVAVRGQVSYLDSGGR